MDNPILGLFFLGQLRPVSDFIYVHNIKSTTKKA